MPEEKAGALFAFWLSRPQLKRSKAETRIVHELELHPPRDLS